MVKLLKISLPALLLATMPLFMAGNAMAQSKVGAWERTFGGPRRDTANMVLPVPGGGFIVAGETQSSGAGFSDAWVIRLDAQGGKMWERTFGGPHNDSATVARPIPRGGFYVVGNTRSRGAGKTDGMVVRLDDQGRTLWEYLFGRSGNDHMLSAANAPRGGLVVAGRTNSTRDGKNDAWIIRLDGTGKVLWERVIGVSGRDDLANFIAAVPGGGFIFIGYKETAGNQTDVWVVRLSNTGRIVWSRSYDYGGKTDRGKSIQPTLTGGFIVAADTLIGSGQNFDAWIFTLDRNGRMGWNEKFGAKKMELLTYAAPTPDGGFVFSGVTESFGRGRADAMFIRLNAKGKLIWAKPVGGRGWDFGASIVPVPGGGFIAAGRTSSKGAGKEDAWILRMDEKGNIR
ncbi:MAG: hypothetical protein IIC64_13665 [SAR324 cluster bacterium]|nr:hypothetical protein [SAR324 cluster bacterium]